MKSHRLPQGLLRFKVDTGCLMQHHPEGHCAIRANKLRLDTEDQLQITRSSKHKYVTH